jgi:hypothetical protein
VKTPRRLTSTYANVLDTVRTMNRTRQAGITTSNERLNLKLKALNKKQVVRALLLILTGSLGLTYANSAVAASSPNQINAYRVYAHERIFNYQQYLCFDLLIQRESHYNDRAVNGNHYGLVQGMSKSLLLMSGYQQIDWALSYIHNRYKTECNALHHSMIKGWY